jgi:serine/threonine protein kinase
MALSLQSQLQQRYCLVKLLGHNGERRTWLATDEKTGTQVTLKTLYFGQDLGWQQFELFERELQILPKLDHPLIPKFLDTFWLEEPEGHYFCIVQQFVPGISLAERLVKGDRFDRGQVEALAQDLLGVLVYIHTQDPPLVHRDIKPSNLIWGDDGKIHLIDFGAVQIMGREGRTLTAAGTFGYMAPEQFVGRATPVSDLYSLGATLVQLLTGLSPRELSSSPGNLRLPEHPALDGWLGTWLEWMVEPTLKHRFSSASEALIAFHQKQQGIIVATEPPLFSLHNFKVDECNNEQLQVALSLNCVDVKELRITKYIATLFLPIIAFCLTVPFDIKNEPGPLILGYGSVFAALCFLLLVPSRIALSAQREIQIKISNGYCEFIQRAMFLPMRHFKFSLSSASDLIVLERETSTDPEKTLKTDLLLQDGKTGRSVQFKVSLKDSELSWLQKQFQLRKEHSS